MISYWKTFEGSPYGTRKDEVRITLSPRKVFLLNQAAYKALGTPQAVEFHFDANRRLIGMSPADPGERNAFQVKAKKNTNYRVITAAAFCNDVGINLDSTVVFNDVTRGKDGIMVMPLEKTIKVARGAR